MKRKWPLLAAGVAAAAAVVSIRRFEQSAADHDDLRDIPDGPHH
jgi:hypothetical protein